MRIVVNECDGKNRRLCLPSGLVFNRVSAVLLSVALKKKNVKISGKQLRLLFREIKAYKAKRPEWKLAEVHSKNGDMVEIVL